MSLLVVYYNKPVVLGLGMMDIGRMVRLNMVFLNLSKMHCNGIVEFEIKLQHLSTSK